MGNLKEKRRGHLTMGDDRVFDEQRRNPTQDHRGERETKLEDDDRTQHGRNETMGPGTQTSHQRQVDRRELVGDFAPNEDPESPLQ